MTTKQDIEKWISQAEAKHTHMIVVCDTYDWSDFPVYVAEGEDVREKANSYQNFTNMSKVMEVYNLRKDIRPQLESHRSFNYD